MTQGDSLNQAFTQDDAEAQRSTQARDDKQADGLQDDKKEIDYKKEKENEKERVLHAKVGNIVNYTKGSGTIVSKDGAYVTIFNESANAYDQVHAGETYIPGDTISMGIMNKLWDQMAQETRTSLLNKANVQEPLHFISRRWSELPQDLKDVLKLSPRSVSVGSGYKGPNVPSGATITGPGGATAKPTRRASAPSKLGTGDTASGAGSETTGQSRSTKPGNKVMTMVGGKKVQVTERQRKIWESNTTLQQRGDKTFTTDYGNKLSGKPSGVKTDSTYKPPTTTAPTTKPTGTTSTPSKIKPSGSGTTGPTGSTSTTASGAAAAESAATRSKNPPKDEGVTFASGLDKAKNYGELTVEIYKIRNMLNKVTGDKIPFEKLGDLPQGKNRLKPVVPGQTKIETSEGEKTLESPADRYGGTSIKTGKIDGKTSFSNLGGKEDPFDKKLIENKSDVEHGAYGGVVTDTPFDAEGDYEEDKRDVHGKEFDHNHQQKTPRDPKEDGKEVLVGYHSKEDGGGMSTSDAGTTNPMFSGKKQPGAYNPKNDPDEDGYKEKSIVNKHNTRYGIRKASKEDIERLYKE